MSDACPACWMDPSDHKYEDCPEWAGRKKEQASLEHRESENCWCIPRVEQHENGNLIIHSGGNDA